MVVSSLHGPAQAEQVHPALDLAVFRQMADMSNDAFYLCAPHAPRRRPTSVIEGPQR
jgi:hypothetical protein